MITTKQKHTLADIRSVPIVNKKGAKGYWQGISHGTLVDILLETASNRGLSLENPKFHLTEEGSDFVGSWDVITPGKPLASILQRSIALMNSNSTHFRMCLYGGIRTDDDCGIPLSHYTLGKHTKHNKIEERIREAFDRWLEESSIYSYHRERLNYSFYTNYTENHLLFVAARNKIITWEKLKKVDELFMNSPKEKWDLLHSFAQGIKECPVLYRKQGQIQSVYQFYQMIRG